MNSHSVWCGNRTTSVKFWEQLLPFHHSLLISYLASVNVKNYINETTSFASYRVRMGNEVLLVQKQQTLRVTEDDAVSGSQMGSER
jgi:hypothetical protein